jgi:hypothetical protein
MPEMLTNNTRGNHYMVLFYYYSHNILILCGILYKIYGKAHLLMIGANGNVFTKKLEASYDEEIHIFRP